VASAPDGSPVELYRLLPVLGEPELIHGAAAEGAEILELGCGVGRITHRLLELGHPVVAVDESAAMLAFVRGADTVCARIEDLDLSRRFPVVLLMSNLVNTQATQRHAFLRACRRHVSDAGLVLIERLAPDWEPEEAEERAIGPLATRVRDVRRTGRFVAGVVEYRSEGRVWQHPFESHLLDDNELGESLAAAGLELSRVLDESGRWVVATPLDAS
jgi:SAM-dependent methyltransferase